MRVRKVDATGDYVFGGNQAAFHRDTPDAVAQIVESRLQLWSGQWYLDLDEGTPYETQVLGKRTEAMRDPALRARILDTPGVTEIADYSSVLNRDTRGFLVSAAIITDFSRTDQQGRTVNTATVTTSVREAR
ncbi:hypothetical protein MPPM_4760 [Methylorubrum populi]|uniref:Bacteriophage protein n=1 Tax=Methylorubrum populi TaxID=223967 RepID=A0A160PK44_9HYPH|nr:hypothetical protein [Methylorubrum populi]BAU93365.1 hypothetical protein MPPM_4760 [Methylorubrum populi]